jgi:hypothetical protein
VCHLTGVVVCLLWGVGPPWCMHCRASGRLGGRRVARAAGPCCRRPPWKCADRKLSCWLAPVSRWLVERQLLLRLLQLPVHHQQQPADVPAQHGACLPSAVTEIGQQAGVAPLRRG